MPRNRQVAVEREHAMRNEAVIEMGGDSDTRWAHELPDSTHERTNITKPPIECE